MELAEPERRPRSVLLLTTLLIALLGLATAVTALVIAVRGGEEAPGDADDAGSGQTETTASEAQPAHESPAVTVTSPTRDGPALEGQPGDAASGTVEPPETAAPGTGSVPAAALPGEPYEFGPAPGMGLSVVGVDYDDALNVRDVPAGETIASLGNIIGGPIDPGLEVHDVSSGEVREIWLYEDEGVVATGNTRKLPTTVWHEVRVAGLTGWASGAYLAPLGGHSDFTEQAVEALGTAYTAPTVREIGTAVVDVVAPDQSELRTVAEVGHGLYEGVGEIILDVMNIGDDSIRGYRLSVFATAQGDWMSDKPGPFTFRGVWATHICYSHRGVSADGLCH